MPPRLARTVRPGGATRPEVCELAPAASKRFVASRVVEEGPPSRERTALEFSKFDEDFDAVLKRSASQIPTDLSAAEP